MHQKINETNKRIFKHDAYANAEGDITCTRPG
jgi:hypothetical protein